MEYSAPTPVSKGLSIPSPRSPLLACANGNVLEIHDLRTGLLQHNITTAAAISHLVWGNSHLHGELIAAASSPTNCVVIVAASSGTVLADILDTPLQIASLSFSPAPQPILLLLHEHSLALNFFCPFRALHLATLPFPNVRRHLIHSFSPCGRFVVVACRKGAKDVLCIIACKTAHVLRCIRLHGSVGICRVASVTWLQNNRGILVGGSSSDSINSLALLSLSGRLLYSGQPYGPAADKPLDSPLGIRSIAFNNSHSLMAISAFDGVLRLVNIHSWTLVKEFGHLSPDISDVHPPIVYRERSNTVQSSSENSRRSANASRIPRARRRTQTTATKAVKKEVRSSYFEILPNDRQVEITKRVRTFNEKSRAQCGICMAQFSPHGRYIATRTDNAANVVYIWDVVHLCLSALLILEEDVKSFKWSRRTVAEYEHEGHEESQLAVACGGDCVYLWKAGGAAAMNISDHIRWQRRFEARKIEWLYDNSALVITDGVSAKAFVTVFINTTDKR